MDLTQHCRLVWVVECQPQHIIRISVYNSISIQVLKFDEFVHVGDWVWHRENNAQPNTWENTASASTTLQLSQNANLHCFVWWCGEKEPIYDLNLATELGMEYRISDLLSHRSKTITASFKHLLLHRSNILT